MHLANSSLVVGFSARPLRALLSRLRFPFPYVLRSTTIYCIDGFQRILPKRWNLGRLLGPSPAFSSPCPWHAHLVIRWPVEVRKPSWIPPEAASLFLLTFVHAVYD